MTTDESIATIAAELRAASAVAIIGAGASVGAGLPLTRQLQPHLWKAVEAHPAVLEALAQRLGRNAVTAKALIGDDEEALRAGYELVQESSAARMVFQQSFRALDLDRGLAFSPTHDALAELLHRRVVEMVISLNWDTMLEAAYLRRYGRALLPDGLWLEKPYGDAGDPASAWVLPGRPGALSDALVQRVSALAAQRPRLLMIIGYSEQDEPIVQHLIQPLESQWRVARIAPGAVGDLQVPLPADEAVPVFRDLIANGTAEVPGWEYVGFQHQNDLGAALDGRGLGPNDVNACPRLPEVATVVSSIQRAHSATVEGRPGCGKSMVAYHAAHELCLSGWEILRPCEPPGDVLPGLGVPDRLPVKTLLLVDDIQRVSASLVRRLRERASREVIVLLVTNDRSDITSGAVHISGKRAVQAIAAALRARRSETLELVHDFDPRVGEGWMDIPLDRRLAEAEKADFPWQFSFILTAGEQRVRQHLAALADDACANLLLTAVAARQLATLDMGSTVEELGRFAAAMGLDAQWVQRALEATRRRRLVIGEERVKCPHQRYAGAVLAGALGSRRSPAWPQLLAVLRTVILDGDPSLSGIAVLLRELWFTAALTHGSRQDTVVDDATWGSLATRCLSAATPAERGGAGYLLEALDGYHPARNDWLLEHAATVGKWFTEATAESAWGLGQIANELGRMPAEIATAVFACADAAAIAASVSSAPLTEAYAWARLLGRLCSGGLEWRASLGGRLSSDPLLTAASTVTSQEAHYIAALSVGLAPYNHDLAMMLLERAAGPIATRISEDFPESYYEFHEAFWFVLDVDTVFGDRRPTPRQRTVAQAILDRLDVNAAAASITRAPRRALSPSARLLFVVREVHRRVANGVVDAIDFDTLDRATAGIWGHPPDELVEFVRGIAHAGSGPEPARTWIARHANEMEAVPAWFAYLATDVALDARSRGAQVDLGLGEVIGWDLPVQVLKRLQAENQTATREILLEQTTKLARELLIAQADQCEHLCDFVTLVQQIAPEALIAAFDRIDPVRALNNWTARLRGSPTERRAAAMLVEAASQSGCLAAVAAELKRRFPRTIRTARDSHAVPKDEGRH